MFDDLEELSELSDSLQADSLTLRKATRLIARHIEVFSVRKQEGGEKYRARQLYKNISMLFLFPVKDGKLSTGVIAIFNASCYG